MQDVVGDDFLSGTSGEVSGLRRTTAALTADLLADGLELIRLRRLRLAAAARRWPARRVLVLAIERTDAPNLLAAARKEVCRSRHEVRFLATTAGDRGKFENLNELLKQGAAEGNDWLLVVDDDVALPPRFLDTFIFLAERFQFQLAQPAHRQRSHAAWEVTRRRPAAIARETGFVEIGPVFALHATTFGALLPFPPLRVGWGLDAHWSALAREHGWRMGVLDACAIRHGMRPIAASYDRRAALDEARQFLAGRVYVPAAQAARTLTTYRSWK